MDPFKVSIKSLHQQLFLQLIQQAHNIFLPPIIWAVYCKVIPCFCWDQVSFNLSTLLVGLTQTLALQRFNWLIVLRWELWPCLCSGARADGWRFESKGLALQSILLFQVKLFHHESIVTSQWISWLIKWCGKELIIFFITVLNFACAVCNKRFFFFSRMLVRSSVYFFKKQFCDKSRLKSMLVDQGCSCFSVQKK